MGNGLRLYGFIFFCPNLKPSFAFYFGLFDQFEVPNELDLN